MQTILRLLTIPAGMLVYAAGVVFFVIATLLLAMVLFATQRRTQPYSHSQ